VDLSQTQVDRLEERGDFPARVPLGARRVGWSEPAITAWMQEKVDARPDAVRTVVQPDDRFIGEGEICRYTSLSRQTLDRYKKRGEFPACVRIGEARKAWLEREVRGWR
jgi:predicted DNA-binding transcriptional regulator AlpA